MIRALVFLCALAGTACLAEVPLRPQARPVPLADLRPVARPEVAPVVAPLVTKALAPQVELAQTHRALAPQEARADALTRVQPVVLISPWQTEPPQFRPEGDFGGDVGTGVAGVDADALALLRPELRPETAQATGPVLLASAAAAMRPQLRPGDLVPAIITDVTPTFDAALALPAAPTLSALAIPVALRPSDRPADIVQQAESARVARVRGSVCGNPQIQGEELGQVSGSGACGVDQGVLVRSVDGVRLSTAGTMDCATAEALQDWVHNVAKPTLAGSGGGLVGLDIMGTYACRNRNSAANGRLSEHGHGKAVDIGGFNLANGGTISVLNGWGTNSYGSLLRKLHAGACGIFGTILGPEANAAHRNHFHFDTASYRSGSYCQ